MVDELKTAQASGQAQSWARGKLEDVFGYEAGRLCGMFAAMEFDDGGGDIYSGSSSWGFGKGKTNINFDSDLSHHGYAHVDLQGRLERFQKQFSSMFGKARIPLDEFMSGFTEGFF